MTDTAGRRIYELAKELDISSKVLREQIVEFGFDWDVSNHMKTLTGEQIDAYNAKVSANAEAPKRIHELAKEMGISSKELRTKITDLGFDWDVSNHMKVLTYEQQGELTDALSGKKKKAPAKKAAAKKAPAKKAAAKKAPAKKAAAKKAPAKKAAAADEEAPKKAAKKPAAKRAAPKKAAADDAEAPKKAAKKPAAKKATPKKAAAADEAATEEKPKRTRTKKADKAADAPAAAETPKRERRERRPEREEVKDPEGFDPVGAGIPYLKMVLKHLGLRSARVTGTYDGRRMELNIKGGGSVALIGSRNAGANGRMLDALQLLVSKVAFGDLSRARTVAIDIDGFRAGRVDALTGAGNRIAEFVKETGLFVRLPAMSNFDRYAFHKSAGRVRGLEVGSEGFGAFRMLGISPRQQRPAREEAPKTEEAAAPVETPAEAAPAKAAPVEVAPVEAAPVEVAAAEDAPTTTTRKRAPRANAGAAKAPRAKAPRAKTPRAKKAPAAAEAAPEAAPVVEEAAAEPTETKRRRRRRSPKTAE